MPIDRDKIAKLLTDRGAINPCDRCGKTQFVVLDAYSQFTLQNDLSAGLVIDGPAVPVSWVACNNCGAMTPHALGPLGLLEKTES